jgi:hypothetical protein
MIRVYYGIGIERDKHDNFISYDKYTQMLTQAHYLLQSNFDGYFIVDGTGFWRDTETGEHTSEEGIGITIYTDKDEATIRYVASQLAKTFKQASILVNTEPANVQFIGYPESTGPWAKASEALNPSFAPALAAVESHPREPEPEAR